MNQIQAILNRLYPLEERKPAQIRLAFIFGLIVFLVMLLLKPFGNRSLLDSGYAGILTFTSIVFDFLVLFPLFPQYFKEEKWTIGREIIFTLIIVTTIASINIIVGHFFFKVTLSVTNWLLMIFYTAVIGIAPAITSILINQARLLKKYRKEVMGINDQLQQPMVQAQITPEPVVNISAAEAKVASEEPLKPNAPPAPLLITIEAENKKDNLLIPAATFLAATSADNYVKVFYLENEQLKTTILRTTLKKLEVNTRNFPLFFRCHRTAIVNMAAVQKLSGSAQGYRLQLQYLAEEIPVSRNLNGVIKQKLAAIHPRFCHLPNRWPLKHPLAPKPVLVSPFI